VTKTPASSIAGSNTRQPLYGHTSEATAYVVADYPYGGLRTQIRYWLEGPKPKKGWRFVSQTLNPKTGKWNAPKASTYLDWGGAMYLDNKGHVVWDGIGPYSDERKILAFAQAFPDADMRELRKVVPAKLRHLQRTLSGEIFWTINGARLPMTEADVERLNGEVATWEEIARIVGRVNDHALTR
jgi:hypothetical protein